MLVLSATYNTGLTSSTTGEPLVEAGELMRLFDRTIRFLKVNEAISPTLGLDADILKHIQHTLFPNELQNRKATPPHLAHSGLSTATSS